MLRDLEKRRASTAERSALPNQVRALPRSEPNRVPWLWLLVVAAALIVAIAWQVRQFSERHLQVPVLPPNIVSLVDITPRPRMALDFATPPEVVAEKKTAPLPRTTEIAQAPPQSMQLKSESKPKSEPKQRSATPSAADAASSEPAVADVKSITLGEKQTTPSADQIDKQVHEMTPQQLAENEYRRAIGLLNQGHLPEAQSGLEAALKLDPTHTAARQGLLGMLLAAKKTDEAERLLQDGLDINPNQPGFALALARLQADRGDTATAIATMQKSEAAAQSSPDYLATLAALLQRATRHAEAVEHYQAALKLAPQSGIWWMGLGISLQALDRGAEARDAFTRAKSSSNLTPELQAFVEQRLQQLR
jgi:MSHA biogenesis protein MshN